VCPHMEHRTKTGEERVLANVGTYTQEQDTDAEKRRGMSLCARVALAAVVAASLIISVSSIMRYNELEEQKAELQAEIDVCNDDIEEKQQLINAPVDQDYIARMARERLGLHYPNENVYYSRINGTVGGN
jgi:cell division protein FtsB